jgi:hypothetical protein
MVMRHTYCGGLIIPDMKNSSDRITYGECLKCKASMLTVDDCVICEEDIDLYAIYNTDTGEYVLAKQAQESRNILVNFETKEYAVEFAENNGITNYEVKLLAGEVAVEIMKRYNKGGEIK